MVNKEPWFVEDRAVAFASLLLTSRPDLVVRKQAGSDDGIDLLVEVLKNGKFTMRYFGVRLKGCVSLPGLDTADEMFESHQYTARSEYTLPLCAFLIDVKKNEGYFTWVVEPTVEEGEPRLVGRDESGWGPLTEAALEKIVDRVTAWYEALRPVTKK